TQLALRHRPHGEWGGKGEGANPPAGAFIQYYLKQKPKGQITLEVLDDKGKPVAKLESKEEPDKKKKPKPTRRTVIESKGKEDDPDAREEYEKPELKTEPGVNRVAWDLRYQGAEMIANAKVDSGDPDQGPLVNPGTYMLK